jgi:hypothetical protein
MHITIELDPTARPIAGRLERTGHPAQRFEGMLELISLLEALCERPASQRDKFDLTERADGH